MSTETRSAFTLPALPYPTDALEPHIDTMTMEIHHGKHHQTYINNLNAALQNQPQLEGKSLEWLCQHLDQVPEGIRTAVRNNGGSHFNHSMFWLLMSPKGGGRPGGELGQALEAAFGSFDEFKKQFSEAAVKCFGSGWAWLSLDKDRLAVFSMPNQDNPLMVGQKPILCLDVWEHAYYLKYQNRRADFVAAWWNLVNWEQANQNYLEARG
jgi:Fe-Mn family superoxide dismutase